LTPADLYRAGIASANAHCVKTYGKSFAKITESQREEFLLGLQAGKVTFENGPPARVFFTTMYQTVMEGMFSDPIYGGNRNKAGWKIIGFPGVIAVHYQNVEKFRDKKYIAEDTLTIRNNPSQEALPMRRLGSFLPGEAVGGSGVHWSGHTWRWTDMEFKVRSLYEERYGKNYIPADMTIQDWGITYAELE